MRLPKQHLRIGLISDTHIEHEGDDVLPTVYERFAGVDLILHAGDIYAPAMLDRLERIAPLVVVAGNGEEDRNVQDPRLTDSRVIELGGLKVGLRHSIVFPEMPPRWTIENEMQRCFGGPVNIVVIGDTHVAGIDWCRGVLVVNPGSPTWPNNLRRQPGTIAMLDIVHGQASARIIDLAE